MKRLAGILLVLLLGGSVVWASADLPARGDPASPASIHESVSVYYIENAYTDTRTPNMVTAVLADYRSFDTFGEAVVVVTAALCALLILLRRREEEEGFEDIVARREDDDEHPDPGGSGS